MKPIEASELILNDDGSVYHLKLKPEQIADTIILVGDQGRVDTIAEFFDSIETESINREFHTKTGYYKGKRLSVLSTGIGTDNIDIVLNELDALVNIDLTTRTIKQEHTKLNLIRIGTSGGLQENIPVDSYLLTEKTLGFDGMMNFYANIETISDTHFEQAFMNHVNWSPRLSTPYVIDASPILLNKLYSDQTIKGVTISAPGFYGPQGRMLRLAPFDINLNEKITSFEYKHYKITNYEMESSALFGLSRMLGHDAVTICAIIANRITKTYSKDYHPVIKNLIQYTLDKLVS